MKVEQKNKRTKFGTMGFLIVLRSIDHKNGAWELKQGNVKN